MVGMGVARALALMLKYCDNRPGYLKKDKTKKKKTKQNKQNKTKQKKINK